MGNIVYKGKRFQTFENTKGDDKAQGSRRERGVAQFFLRQQVLNNAQVAIPEERQQKKNTSTGNKHKDNGNNNKLDVTCKKCLNQRGFIGIYFCLQWRIYACYSCRSDHDDHGENVDEIKTIFTSLKKQLEQFRTSIASQKQELETLSSKHKQHINDVNKTVNARFDALVCKVEDDTNEQLSVIEQHFIDKMEFAKLFEKKINFFCEYQHRIRELLKENDPYRVIKMGIYIRQVYPNLPMYDGVLSLKIIYPFKVSLQRRPDVRWSLRCNNEPFDISDFIQIGRYIDLKRFSKIKLIKLSGKYLFISNGSYISKCCENAGRLTEISRATIEHRYFDVFNDSRILICCNNILQDVSFFDSHASKTIKSFAENFVQSCFICEDESVWMCLTSTPEFDISNLPIRSSVVKCNILGKTVLKIDMNQKGLFYFKFPMKCYENSVTGDVCVINRTEKCNGQLFIFDRKGDFLQIFNGSHKKKQHGFFPTDLIIFYRNSISFIATVDYRNNVIYVLDRFGTPLYFVSTKRSRHVRIPRPYCIFEENGEIYVLSTQTNRLEVLKTPNIDEIFDKEESELEVSNV